MSAIFGILRFDGGAVAPRELERMAGAMAHRMPDGRKLVVDGPIGLGHGLMRVNEEDLYEAQPLHDREASLTLVADCRIDNREELAAAFGLSAAQIRDMPDSAFILAAYKKWGEGCPAHLLGDFAFAIWDGRAKSLFLARDHVGQRYVHYHHAPGFFAFATELRGLWAASGVPRALKEAALAKDLVHDMKKAPGTTLFEGVAGVPAGRSLTIAAGGEARMRTYWQPQADPVHLNRDEDYYVERYRAILTEAVGCRLRRLLRPPALCLSGGFDSGAIAALSGPVVTAQGRKLIAAASTMGEGETGYRDARAAVEACGRVMPHLDLRYYVRGAEETLLSDLDDWFLATSATQGNNYVYRGLFDIARAAGARLVMDGYGGDYTLNYRGKGVWGVWLREGAFIRVVREFRAHMRVHRCSAWQVLRFDVLPALLPASLIDGWRRLKRGGIAHWRMGAIGEPFARRMIAEDRIDLTQLVGTASRTLGGRAWCLQVLDLIMGRTRPGLALFAGSFGLDHTRPFHDRRVVELALAIPQALYVKNGRDRHLARRALAGLLPRERLESIEPNGAYDPDFPAMVRSVAPYALAEAERLGANPRMREFVDFAKARTILGDAQAGRGLNDRQRMSAGLQAVIFARFIEWFEGENA